MRLIENLIGMAKCSQGLQYSKTAEDIIAESLHIIARLEKTPPQSDIDNTRLRRIGIDIKDEPAPDAEHFFSLKVKQGMKRDKKEASEGEEEIIDDFKLQLAILK